MLGLVGGDSAVVQLALELEAETERPCGSYSPRLVHGIELLRTGRLEEARAALESDHADAVAFGDEAGLPPVLAQLAELELRAGGWDAATRYSQTGVEIAERLAVPHLQAAALAVRARVWAHLGALDEARAAAACGARLAADANVRLAASENAAALGFVELSAQRPLEADRHLRPLLAEPDAAAHWTADAIEAMLESGAVDDAHRHVEAIDARGVARAVRAARRELVGGACSR